MPIDCDDKLLLDLSSPPVLFPPFAQSHPISFVRSTVADNLLNSTIAACQTGSRRTLYLQIHR